MLKTLIELMRNLRQGHRSQSLTEKGIQYRDIPLHTNPGLVHEGYPQVIGVPLMPREQKFFCQRYADELQFFFNRLALSKEEIDDLLMPVLARFINLVNVLPASETHHHSGACGLFVHSVQCAAAAVMVAEQRLLDRDASLRQRYQDRPRWLVAAGVMGLVHDAGKVFDVEVLDEAGRSWDPFSESLWQWTRRVNAQRLFVVWRKNRIHKQHELRSVRLAYRCLFTNELIGYLSEISGDVIPGAIDEAIVFGSGPLGNVLKDAEAVSMQQDGVDRKRLGRACTEMSSPLVTPIFAAVRECITSGLWSVNGENSQVYVTCQGVFLRLNEAAATDIHQAAVRLRAPYVPGTPEGLVRVLQEQNLVEMQAGQSTAFCSIEMNAVKKRACIKLSDPLLLFPDGVVPKAMEVVVRTEGMTEELSTEGKEVKKAKSALCFLAPQEDFSAPSKERRTKEQGAAFAKAECDVVLKEPMPPQQAKQFVDRLIRALSEQLRNGEGFLIENFRVLENGRRYCSSRKVEAALERRKISQKTQEILLRLCLTGLSLDFDPKDHSFILDKDGENEESKSGTGSPTRP